MNETLEQPNFGPLPAVPLDEPVAVVKPKEEKREAPKPLINGWLCGLLWLVVIAVLLTAFANGESIFEAIQ